MISKLLNPNAARGLDALVLTSVVTAISFGQGKPPLSIVPEPFNKNFERYVDTRSMKERTLNSVGLTSQDVGRSFALIAGVSKYPRMVREADRELSAARADVEALKAYLADQEFFDEIVVLRDGDVTDENLRYFLENYFPDRLRHFPKSRFIFVYSGHGMQEGPKDNPKGYLLKSSALSFTDKLNSIDMSVLRVYLGEVIESGYQTLALINACYSGAFLSRRPFGGTSGSQAAGGIYFPKFGGAHAIAAGGSNQQSWHDPTLGKGSVFFEKLLAGLGGQADTFPIYADGRRGDGIITVDEIATYLREEVSFATHQQQTPIPADLAPNRSQGGFFFLNRQRMNAMGLVPAWNSANARSFGTKAEDIATAIQYYDNNQLSEAFPLFLKLAESGNGKAAMYVAKLYESYVKSDVFSRDLAKAAAWYLKAVAAGEKSAMSDLGTLYAIGGPGLPKDIAQSISWFRKGAEAGDLSSMFTLANIYADGNRGLPKDDKQAVRWYRSVIEAADRGDRFNVPGAMNNLARMYAEGLGGLPKSDTQAVTLFSEAAHLGSNEAMYNLATRYEKGIGLPKDPVQAVDWYRKAAADGNSDAKQALTRLGVEP